MQGRLTEKKLCKEVKKKNFLQNELHCWAYKLYSPEEHLGSHFILQD